MGKVLSIDLALRRVSDLGVCLIEERNGKVAEVRFLDAERELGLEQPLTAQGCAEAIKAFCRQNRVGVLLLDGPQGWKDPSTRLRHSRACERVLHTQGKVGVDEQHVKPPSWRRFAKFSIDLFSELEALGASRVIEPMVRARKGALVVVESFPTAAWPMLGIEPLPSKAKFNSSDLKQRFQAVQERFGFRVRGVKTRPTHDELQALVAGLAGVAILVGDPSGYVAIGLSPKMRKRVWVEGYIVCPRLGAR